MDTLTLFLSSLFLTEFVKLQTKERERDGKAHGIVCYLNLKFPTQPASLSRDIHECILRIKQQISIIYIVNKNDTNLRNKLVY